MDLRPLTSDDAERLLALHRACPIEADFSFYFDRSPSFFAWPDAAFDGYAYVGGFEGDELVGCALLATAGCEAHGGTFSYAGDARVLPSARGRGFLRRAAAALAPLVAPPGVAVGLVKRGNAAAAGALASLGVPGLAVSSLCAYRAVNLLLVRPAPAALRCHVRRAREDDLPLLADLMARAFRGRPFAPPATVEALLRDLVRLPGLAVEDFYLAFTGGEPVGALGAWDSDSVRRIAVLRYSWRGQLARVGYALACRLYPGAVSLPAPGDSFRAVTTTRVAVPRGDPAILHDLLAAVYRDRLGRGFHMIHMGLAERDPLLAGVRGFPRQTFVSDLVLVATPGGERWLPDGGPPYLDLRYV
jgi:GNAT superfamily N-acetyltransferase